MEDKCPKCMYSIGNDGTERLVGTCYKHSPYVRDIRGERIDEDKVYASCPSCAALRGEVASLQAALSRYRDAGRKFREAIGGDYQKAGHKVTCIVLMESFAEFDEAFRR